MAGKLRGNHSSISPTQAHLSKGKTVTDMVLVNYVYIDKSILVNYVQGMDA